MDKLLNLIGLAKKAGKLEVGEEPVGAAARSKHARLILIASDAADNTRRRALHFGEASAGAHVVRAAGADGHRLCRGRGEKAGGK